MLRYEIRDNQIATWRQVCHLAMRRCLNFLLLENKTYVSRGVEKLQNAMNYFGIQ